MIADDIKCRPFWHQDFHDGFARVNGSETHHCDICQIPPDERCYLACWAERAKIKDGVTVVTCEPAPVRDGERPFAVWLRELLEDVMAASA